MRREGRYVALGLAMLFSMAESFAASPPAKPDASAPVASPISDALCGRAKGRPMKRAAALDDLNLDALPPDWGTMEEKTLQRWLEARICSEPSEEQTARYTARRRMLEELGRRLERAKSTEQVGATLQPFRGWRSGSEEWPSDLECGGCAELRSTTARVADIASRWPVQKSSTLGALLKDAIQHEDLIAELCAAKPSPSARAEIERKFQYYSWTASAARLFEVAALFEKPQIVAECRGR